MTTVDRRVAGAAAAGATAAAALVAGARRRRRRPSRAYRLRADAPLPDELRRVAIGRIDGALDALRGRSDVSAEVAVHEARKDMKKLRAVLRLTRAELGDDLFRAENAAARDTARLLAGARDATVMIETLDALEGPRPAALRGALVERRARLAADEAGRRRAAAEAEATLRGLRGRVHFWPIRQHGFEAIEPGLRRVYRQGRRALAAAADEPSTERLHEWRKREKDLWYHLRLLRDAWPGPMEAAAGEASALADLLGDDHDLAVLLDAARDLGHGDALEPLVTPRRARLQADALELGGRLYAERPAAFAARLRTWWEAA